MAQRSADQPRPIDPLLIRERKGPWYRRISGRTGLQGKLVLCFMFLLTAALGASCYLFVSDTREVLDHMVGEQAQEISRTLAMAAETPLERGDAAELNRVGADLLKNRGIVAVAFFDARGTMLGIASRDQDLERAGSMSLPNPRLSGLLGRLQNRWMASLGSYVELTTPVTAFSAGAARGIEPQPPAKATSRIIGYVTVCIGQGDNDWRLRNVQLTVVLIGAVAVLVSLPVMYGLVHRIFTPIRQLVGATEKIAAGHLDTQVAIDRPDVIGTLARSFNEMINRVKRQQDDLAEANAKLAEANRQLANTNQDLEQKVRQRTAQLEATAGQLESANHRLSSEIAEKEDFLRTVSHDLNAPLRNIAGMATMLLMKHRATFDPDVVHRLERIQKNVQVETDLIGELLELSRIKTRRQKMETVDVAALVVELGEVLAQDLESRQIKLVIDTPMPPLECERARLRQVFQNLIDNAIKYMGDGSPQGDGAAGPENPRVNEIHVGCSALPGEAEFYVRDTGIGIDREDVDKVFRVFRRGKSDAVQSVSGKGVGLASVKSIIETYSGMIRVESQLGRGSTFRFTINGKYVKDAAAMSVAPAAPQSAQREATVNRAA